MLEFDEMASNKLERPRVRAKVLSWIIEGLADAQIARQVSCSRQAVTAFRKRHAAELRPLVAEVTQQITDYAIAEKVNRIAALDDRWQRMKRLINARARDARYADEPGYETGLMVHQLKAVGRGEDFQLVDLYVTDAGLLAEMRATERAVAEELAQLPKVGIEVNVDARTVQLSWEPVESV